MANSIFFLWRLAMKSIELGGLCLLFRFAGACITRTLPNLPAKIRKKTVGEKFTYNFVISFTI